MPAPDPIRLTVPKAYVTLAHPTTRDRAAALSIFSFLRDRLAPYKRMRRIEFREPPKTISGKIRRVELRQREAELVERGERAEREFRVEEFRGVGGADLGPQRFQGSRETRESPSSQAKRSNQSVRAALRPLDCRVAPLLAMTARVGPPGARSSLKVF